MHQVPVGLAGPEQIHMLMKIRREYAQKQKTVLSRWYQVNMYISRPCWQMGCVDEDLPPKKF